MNQRTKGKPPRRGAAVPSTIWVPFLLGLMVYARSLANGFVWDDVNFIVENPLAHDLGGLGTALARGYGWVPGTATGGDSALYFRPVIVLANTLQWVTGGGAPWVFHLLNVLAHATSSALLAGLVLSFGLGNGAALLAGALFAVHPAYSEAVLWISGRTDLFAAGFGLGALLVIARGDRLPRAMRGGWPAGVLLLLALLSKESAVAVALVAPLVALACNRDRLRAHLTSIGLAVGVYLLLRVTTLGGLGSSGLPDRGPLGERLLQAGALAATYLARLVFPWPSRTDPVPMVERGTLSLPLALLGLGILIGLALCGFAALRRLFRPALGRGGTASRFFDHPAAAIGLALYLLALAPVLQLIPTGEVYGERFLYLPAAGAMLALATLLGPSLSAARAQTMLFALVLPFSALLQLRVADWQSDLTLFTRSVQVAPESPRAQANLGSALMKAGRANEAEPHLARAVELDRGRDPQKRAQYGSLLVNLGRVDEGVAHLEAAHQQGLRSTILLKNLGIGWTRQGRGAEASAVLSEALGRSPDDAGLLEALAMARRKAGAFEESAGLFERAIGRDPGRKGAYLNLISIRANELRDPATAIGWCDRFLARFADAPEATQVRTLRAALAGQN